MNAKKLLRQVVESGSTEDKGVVIGYGVPAEVFITHCFGECDFIAGLYKENTDYLYCYEEPLLRGVPDMILENKEYHTRIYLYEVE